MQHILHDKGKYRVFQDYDKYEKHGDLHWKWYADNKHGYHSLVEDSLKPFLSVAPLDISEKGKITVVDIGCGDGLPLSKLYELGYKCYGVDPSKVGIDLALKEHDVSAEFFIEKAEKFAERGLDFDYLYCLNTIEHMDRPEALLEIMKHIRKFGIIVTDDATLHKDPSVYHSKEFTPTEFEKLFKDFKLEKLNITHKSYFGYKVSNK